MTGPSMGEQNAPHPGACTALNWPFKQHPERHFNQHLVNHHLPEHHLLEQHLHPLYSVLVVYQTGILKQI